MIYLDQYRSNITGGIGNYINDVPSEYIEQVSDGKASKIIVNTTSLGGNNVSIDFQDSCVVLDSSLSSNKVYYLDCKFKANQTSEQTFYLMLIDSSGINESQFIESFTVPVGQEFVDKDFVFQPFASYDTIVFELIRIPLDYTTEPRVPIICYNELSEIKNIIETKNLGNRQEFLKIGVQSRPFSRMMINGEGIRINKTGIYELREDDLKINSFSLFARGVNVLTNEEIVSGKTKEEDLYKDILSDIVLFSHQKEREIIQFSLDFCYEE